MLIVVSLALCLGIGFHYLMPHLAISLLFAPALSVHGHVLASVLVRPFMAFASG
jgi:hypothetical protein